MSCVLPLSSHQKCFLPQARSCSGLLAGGGRAWCPSPSVPANRGGEVHVPIDRARSRRVARARPPAGPGVDARATGWPGRGGGVRLDLGGRREHRSVEPRAVSSRHVRPDGRHVADGSGDRLRPGGSRPRHRRGRESPYAGHLARRADDRGRRRFGAGHRPPPSGVSGCPAQPRRSRRHHPDHVRDRRGRGRGRRSPDLSQWRQRHEPATPVFAPGRRDHDHAGRFAMSAGTAPAVRDVATRIRTAPTGSAGRRPARRWLVLVVVCTSLIVITIDNTILNVAIPTLAQALHAGNSRLQWIVDAYTLVFAGLLLSAGALGDRFGRRRCMTIGLGVFGTASVASALTTSSGQLVMTRGAMGVGGALIMPATLSIITNVFTEPVVRAKAIAVWAGIAGLGIGIGPLAGGLLLGHFYWGSVFLVNVPIVVVAMVGARLVVPESRDPNTPSLDPVGAGLSIVGLGTLLYAIIEGPETGWSSTVIVASFGASAVLLALFVVWELRVGHPMLDLRFFTDARFTVACIAIMAVFFALFSTMFMMTQLLQSVLGYDTLEAGARVLPLSIMLVVFSQVSARAAARVGTKVVVSLGLVVVAGGLAIGASFGSHSTYAILAVTVTSIGIGMGCVMAPATEAIMGSIPRHKAGVGSAVNDTTRQLAGALGVAVIGTVLSSGYRTDLADALDHAGLPEQARRRAATSISSAIDTAHRVGGERGERLLAAARDAFIHAAGRGFLVAASVAVVGAIVAACFLPSRASGDAVPGEDRAAGVRAGVSRR